MTSLKSLNINAWLRLIRIPNIMTLPGDIFVGIALSNFFFTWQEASLLILSSICFYFAGLILNDICDYQEDIKLKRFQRPLVSGEITIKQAKKALCFLIVLGLTLSSLCSLISLIIACLLLGLIYIYNCWARKYSYLGFFIMGLCRSCNIFLGASLGLAAGKSLQINFWLFSLLAGFYIFLICRIAYDEEKKVPAQFWVKSFLSIPIILITFICLSIYSTYIILAYTSSLNIFSNKLVKLISIIGDYWLSLIILIYFCKIILEITIKIKPNFNAKKIPTTIGRLIRTLILYQAFITSFYLSSYFIPIMLVIFYFISYLWSRKFYSS